MAFEFSSKVMIKRLRVTCTATSSALNVKGHKQWPQHQVQDHDLKESQLCSFTYGEQSQVLLFSDFNYCKFIKRTLVSTSILMINDIQISSKLSMSLQVKIHTDLKSLKVTFRHTHQLFWFYIAFLYQSTAYQGHMYQLTISQSTIRRSSHAMWLQYWKVIGQSLCPCGPGRLTLTLRWSSLCPIPRSPEAQSSL